MNNYLEYIKCGDILISRSLNYKEPQHILKCSECNEYYADMDEFLNHSIRHFYNKSLIDEEYEKLIDTNAMKQESIPGDEIEEGLRDEKEHEKLMDTNDMKPEFIPDAIEELPSTTIIKEEPILQENSNRHSYTEEEEDQCMQEDPLNSCPETDDELKDSEDSKSSVFVTNFMKSETKLTTFIMAYKKQANLWNTSLPKRTRTKERSKDLQLITKTLKEQNNVDITDKQVASIIRRLHLKYRIYNSTKSHDPTTPWYIDHLEFLKPFMENKAIVKLDCLQSELAPEQIIHLIDIYKKFPNLWNTDLVEYCCSNKSQEALVEMERAVNLKLGLKLNQNNLKRYIRCIHHHFAREKRLDEEHNGTADDVSQFYKHMTFLFDHVGPFKCECKRVFKSPLAFKVHKSHHDGSIPLTCSLCKKDYRTTEAYMSHARSHMNDFKHQCSECGKKFLKFTQLEIHTHTHKGDKPFCCELCGASFRHNAAFITHKRRHDKNYLHKCSICSKGFYKKDHLDVHLRTHGILQDFVCKICGKGFKRIKNLQEHELKHETLT